MIYLDPDSLIEYACDSDNTSVSASDLINYCVFSDQIGYSQEVFEDYMLPKSRIKKYKDPRLQKIARERWRKYRGKYAKAFSTFRKSARGKTFYRKLGRLKTRQ